MNFDVMCFGWVGQSLRVVNHEYFETFEEARDYANVEEAAYEGKTITPMNAEAERILRERWL